MYIPIYPVILFASNPDWQKISDITYPHPFKSSKKGESSDPAATSHLVFLALLIEVFAINVIHLGASSHCLWLIGIQRVQLHHANLPNTHHGRNLSLLLLLVSLLLVCLEKSRCPFKHSPKLEQSSDIVKCGCFYLSKKNDTKYSNFVFTYSIYIYTYIHTTHVYRNGNAPNGATPRGVYVNSPTLV